MLYIDFTAKLLEMEDVIVDSIVHDAKTIEIHLHQRVKKSACPSFQSNETVVHDYRCQRIRDIPMINKQSIIVLRKRRYKCKHCGKQFLEPVAFLPRYHRMTNRLSAFVIEKLAGVRSFVDVAKEVGLSVSTVLRIFDLVQYPKPKTLPQVLAIDEFKGNTRGEKYQCILTDAQNKVVLDILPKRYEHFLTEYFNRFDKSQRDKVQFFVSDMWKPYSNISSVWFKNASQIVDKYHWIRQVIWAFEAVRKQEQKKFSKSHRRYFKQSRQLLLKRFDLLSDEQKQQVNVMLFTSPTLSTAHFYKEDFLKILDCKDRQSAKTAFSDWINSALDCGIAQFVKCANSMLNWLPGILNSFSSVK